MGGWVERKHVTSSGGWCLLPSLPNLEILTSHYTFTDNLEQTRLPLGTTNLHVQIDISEMLKHFSEYEIHS